MAVDCSYYKKYLVLGVLTLGIYTTSSLPLHAGTINLYRFKYDNSIVLPYSAEESFLTGVRIPYDIAQETNLLKDLRIVDNKSSFVPFKLIDQAPARKKLVLPTLDWYQEEKKDIITVDVEGIINNNHITLDEKGKGNGVVSLFGTTDYYGIDYSPWATLVRDQPISDQDAVINYPTTRYPYLMIVYNHHATSSPDLIRALQDNPRYADSIEESYIRADTLEDVLRKDSTIVLLDRGTSAFEHFSLGISLSRPPEGDSLLVETSTDNNHWIPHGIVKINKQTNLSIEYTPTTDRYIRVTIPGEDILGSQLVAIRTIPKYVLFRADPHHTYTLYYGSSYAQPLSEDPSISDDEINTFIESKLGIREQNPSYIDSNKADDQSFADQYPYAETMLLLIGSGLVLYVVLTVITKK